MPKENFPLENTDDHLIEKERELVKVEQLEQLKDYEIYEDCVIEEYASDKKTVIPAGYHFFIYKVYPEYININVHNEGTTGNIYLSLKYSQELPIRRKE